MIWHSLQFGWPFAASFFLFLLLIVWAAFSLYRYRQRSLEKFAKPAVLNVVVEQREPLIYWLKVFLFCLAWTCGVLALMQPKGNERYLSTSPGGLVSTAKKPSEKTPMRKNTHEVVFLIDASSSMNIADVSSKTRLEVAKEIVDDVIRHLKGENVSLYTFTSATIQIVPPTLDYFFTRLMLQQIEINEGDTEGTDIKQALEFFKKLYITNRSNKTKTLVILSDGGDTRLEGLTGEARLQTILDIISPMQEAPENKMRIFSVGIASAVGKEVPGTNFQGRPVVSQLEKTLLQKLSDEGNGEFFVVGQMTPLEISNALSQKIARDESFVDVEADQQLPDMGQRTQIYDDYFQYCLEVVILALLGYLFIPDTRKKIKKPI